MGKQSKLKGRHNQKTTPPLFSWWSDIIDYNDTLLKHTFNSAAGMISLFNQASQTFMDMCSNAMPEFLAIFDPQIVLNTLSYVQIQILQESDKKPTHFLTLYQEHIQQFQKLLSNTYKEVQGKKPAQAVVAPHPRDKRFQDPAWDKNPYFNFIKQSYLLQAKFLSDIIHSLENLPPDVSQKIDFYMNFFVDAMAPTNFIMTNPSVLREVILSKGESLRQGLLNFTRDVTNGKTLGRTNTLPSFQLGKNIAATPGKVVFQNDLFQLIQYMPTTQSVSEIPLLIIPPWINKYYVFDLTEENSFVRWALDAGLTVFIISWINPDKRYAKKSFEDYLFEGVNEAINHVCKLLKVPQVNTLGYCAGGMALISLMGYLAQKKLDRIKSSTVIATPVNTKEATGILAYTCEQQLKKLETYMTKKGYLPGKAMEISFNMLRANDMIWSAYVKNYLLGQEPVSFDILHWNGDSTRMPARMHTEYLRHFFIENRLMKQGKAGLRVAGTPIDLARVKTPVFVFGTVDDHIAPWKSVFPLAHLTSGPTQFILGKSGHVAGVFNHPSRQKYGYWMNNSLSKDPNQWLAKAKEMKGSWWSEWHEWLKPYCGESVKPRVPEQKEIIENAPGRYARMMDE